MTHAEHARDRRARSMARWSRQRAARRHRHILWVEAQIDGHPASVTMRRILS